MTRDKETVPVGGMILFLLVVLNGIILSAGLTGNKGWYWMLCISLPLLLIGILNIVITRRTFRKTPGFAKPAKFFLLNKRRRFMPPVADPTAPLRRGALVLRMVRRKTDL